MQMTRKVLAWNLARGLLVDSEQFPVAYDSPVPIDMKPKDLRLIKPGVDCTHKWVCPFLGSGIVRLLVV